MPCVKQRKQCHNAALAVVVGAQDQNGVFERDDQEKRPEDHRHDAHHRIRGGRPTCLDGLLQRIERAGADIAVDDTERGKHRGGGMFSGVLPGQPRGLKGVGHPDVLVFRVPQVCTKMAP
jgi:hypothetical protein